KSAALHSRAEHLAVPLGHLSEPHQPEHHFFRYLGRVQLLDLGFGGEQLPSGSLHLRDSEVRGQHLPGLCLCRGHAAHHVLLNGPLRRPGHAAADACAADCGHGHGAVSRASEGSTRRWQEREKVHAAVMMRDLDVNRQYCR
ncbi:unnamed protein product, partial [Effrenium voratum]